MDTEKTCCQKDSRGKSQWKQAADHFNCLSHLQRFDLVLFNSKVCKGMQSYLTLGLHILPCQIRGILTFAHWIASGSKNTFIYNPYILPGEDGPNAVQSKSAVKAPGLIGPAMVEQFANFCTFTSLWIFKLKFCILYSLTPNTASLWHPHYFFFGVALFYTNVSNYYKIKETVCVCLQKWKSQQLYVSSFIIWLNKAKQ